MLTVGSLFAGIGGIELGLEWTGGFQTVWQCEIDPYAKRVLAKHWPDVPRWDDVRTFPPEPIKRWKCDVICGGFPCQGISAANFRATGLADERSGLWSEYARVLRVLRPRWVIIENVPALTFRGLDTVLGDLSTLGYDAEWQTISAQAIGSPITRDRLFVVASTASERCHADGVFGTRPPKTTSEKQAARTRCWPGQCQHSPALPDRVRWCPDAAVCRMVDGLPGELDRYRAVGNAVVPQVVQWIGEQILEAEKGKQ